MLSQTSLSLAFSPPAKSDNRVVQVNAEGVYVESDFTVARLQLARKI